MGFESGLALRRSLPGLEIHGLRTPVPAQLIKIHIQFVIGIEIVTQGGEILTFIKAKLLYIRIIGKRQVRVKNRIPPEIDDNCALKRPDLPAFYGKIG